MLYKDGKKNIKDIIDKQEWLKLRTVGMDYQCLNII